MIEQGRERFANSVDLVAAIELNVLWRHLSIQCQVPSSRRRCHAEAVSQVRSPNLTHEVQTEVDIGQPLPLGVAQALNALGVHNRAPHPQETTVRPKDTDLLLMVRLSISSN